MAGRRRDQTYEIPPATLAELQASRKKLAPRQDTWEIEHLPAVKSEPPVPDGSGVASLHHPPRGKLVREDVEAELGPHLEPFTPARRLAVVQAFAARSYARACALLEDEAKRQPKNISLSKEAKVLRAYILARLESEIGGLAVKPRKAKPLSTIEAPPELSSMLRRIDGISPVERIVRESEVDRIRALDFLLDLARSGYLDLLVEDGQVPEQPSLPPAVSGSGTRPKTEPPRAGEIQPVAATELDPRALQAEPIVEAQPILEAQPISARPVASAPLDELPRAAEPSQPPGPVRARPRIESADEPMRPSRRSSSREIPTFVPIALGAIAVLAIALTVLFFLRKPDAPASAPAPTQQPAPPVVATTPATAAKPAETAAPAPAMETVHVKIEAEPKYARVTLDGVLLTGKPIEIDIPKDGKEHVLQVESTGFRTHSAKFVADSNASFAISLQRLPPKPN